MGILQRITSAISPKARMLGELADIAGQNQSLVERLQRHAALCSYPSFTERIAKIAAEEALHVKELNAILAKYNLWSRPPAKPAHQGINNWQRLSSDLDLLTEIRFELARHALRWEGIDDAIAGQLMAIGNADDQIEIELRAIAAKFDPQAID